MTVTSIRHLQVTFDCGWPVTSMFHQGRYQVKMNFILSLYSLEHGIHLYLLTKERTFSFL
jgi:hypothetical protein